MNILFKLRKIIVCTAILSKLTPIDSHSSLGMNSPLTVGSYAVVHTTKIYKGILLNIAHPFLPPPKKKSLLNTIKYWPIAGVQSYDLSPASHHERFRPPSHLYWDILVITRQHYGLALNIVKLGETWDIIKIRWLRF